MKKAKRILAALAAAALLPALSGCVGGSLYANYREVKDLQVIQTLGVDTAEGGALTLTASSGGGISGAPPSILSAKGDTLSAAMDKLRDYASRNTLFFPHTRYLVLGEAAAQAGIAPYLDYIARVPQMRTDASLFIVRGGKAKTLITGAGDGSYDATDELGFLTQDVEDRGTGKIFSAVEISRRLAESGAALVYVVQMADSEGMIYSGGGGLSALPGGYGVVKDGSLCGYIPDALARGVSLFEGSVTGGGVTVTDQAGKAVSLFLLDGKAQTEPVWGADGSLEKLRVTAEIVAAVEELTEPEDARDAAFYDHISAQLARQTRGWLTGILDFSQSLQADFLELGRQLRRADPVKFSQMPGSWEDALAGADFEVEVRSVIRHGYENARPLELDGRGMGGAA